MKVSFFEEFPNKKNLDKLKLINFPAKLYIASKSIEEFEKISNKIKNKYIEEIVYWPILDIEEGYWFSPFSSRKALKRVILELKDKKIPLMWDSELPKNRKMLLTQAPLFFSNKKLITSFFKNYKGKIYVAEYFGRNKLFKFLGLNFETCKNRFVIKMFYTSMNTFLRDLMKRYLINYKKDYGKNLIIGLGTIARGILGNEPVLKPFDLRIDLELCKENNIEEVVIFRLGGLNKNYLKEINKVIFSQK